MKRELAEQFSREVDNYRKSLLYYARACDWATFEAKAGKLFDYVESVEFRELERRFFTIFNLILSILALVIIGLFTVDFEAHAELIRLKKAFILSALAASSYELYFYVGYRLHAESRTVQYGNRRRNFIRNIEQDFRGYSARPGMKEVAENAGEQGTQPRKTGAPAVS